MTALGKILVFVNLLFSLVTGALIVTVYSTRTNWKEQFDRSVRELKVAREDRNTYAAKADKLELTRQQFETDRVRLLDDKNKAIQDADRQTGDLQKQLAAAEQNSKNADLNFKKATADAEGRLSEVVRLSTLIKEREKAIIGLEAQSNTLRTEKTQFEIQYRSENDRNKALVAQLQTMTKEMEKAKQNATATSGPSVITNPTLTSNPPGDDLEGLVSATDAQSGYVTVTLGSDAGLNIGNTLEVFRTTPEPKYLGSIRIINVNHHEAVGRPVSNIRNGVIKPGDRVASKLTGSR